MRTERQRQMYRAQRRRVKNPVATPPIDHPLMRVRIKVHAQAKGGA